MSQRTTYRGKSVMCPTSVFKFLGCRVVWWKQLHTSRELSVKWVKRHQNSIVWLLKEKHQANILYSKNIHLIIILIQDFHDASSFLSTSTNGRQGEGAVCRQHLSPATLNDVRRFSFALVTYNRQQKPCRI